jgi:hypothetical protein
MEPAQTSSAAVNYAEDFAYTQPAPSNGTAGNGAQRITGLDRNISQHMQDELGDASGFTSRDGLFTASAASSARQGASCNGIPQSQAQQQAMFTQQTPAQGWGKQRYMVAHQASESEHSAMSVDPIHEQIAMTMRSDGIVSTIKPEDEHAKGTIMINGMVTAAESKEQELIVPTPGTLMSNAPVTVVTAVQPVPDETEDEDDVMECEFFDTRQAFLNLCQARDVNASAHEFSIDAHTTYRGTTISTTSCAEQSTQA